MASHVLQELPKTQRLCLYHDHDPAQHFCLFCLLSLVRKKMSADTRKLLKEESLEAIYKVFFPQWHGTTCTCNRFPGIYLSVIYSMIHQLRLMGQSLIAPSSPMDKSSSPMASQRKEEGKIYASEVRGIMNLIRRVQNPAGFLL